MHSETSRMPHMQSLPLTYHQLLDRHRQTHGLSYQQLAERAWTIPSYAHRRCRGDARLGYTIVLRLSIAMALTLAETDEPLRVAGYPPLLEIKTLSGRAAAADGRTVPPS